MNYGWRFMTLYRRQGSRPSPWKRNAKWLSEGALQIAEKREAKEKGEKKDLSKCRVPNNSKEIRKPYSIINAKK